MFDVSKIRGAIRTVSSVNNAVKSIVSVYDGSHRAVDVVSAIISIAELGLDLLNKKAISLEASEGWYKIQCDDFSYFLINTLQKRCQVNVYLDSDSESRVNTVTLNDGVKFGWYSDFSTGKIEGCSLYCQCTDNTTINSLIADFLRNELAFDHVVVQSTKTNSHDAYVFFDEDKLFNTYESKTASECVCYLQKCMSAGINRSMLFGGPPGTGKSTIVKTIVHALNMRSLRFCVSDFRSLDQNVIEEAIRIFNPDAVILDDFDRSDSESWLSTLEMLHTTTKLVLATVNRTSVINAALMRPGRFDELIGVYCLEAGAVAKILGEKNLHLLPQVKEWPVVYINELLTRMQFQSENEAISSMNELRTRISVAQNQFETDNDMLLPCFADSGVNTRPARYHREQDVDGCMESKGMWIK